MACFMCNKFDEYGNEEIFNLKTRSTQLTVNEAIRKFIDFKTFDKRVKETTTICVTCLDRIDEYDDACLKLQQHESDLKEIFDGKKPWQNIVIENPCEEENDVTDNVDVDISGISIKFYEEMEEDDMMDTFDTDHELGEYAIGESSLTQLQKLSTVGKLFDKIGGSFVCETCGSVFDNRAVFKRHLRMEHARVHSDY